MPTVTPSSPINAPTYAGMTLAKPPAPPTPSTNFSRGMNSRRAFSQSIQPLHPTPSGPPQPSYSLNTNQPPSQKPNYQLSLASMSPPLTPTTLGHPPAPQFATPVQIMTPLQPPVQPNFMSMPMNSLLTPAKPMQPAWNNPPKKPSKDDWASFDPLA